MSLDRLDALEARIRELVKLVQEFRDFDFMSPWEGAPLLSTLAGAPEAGMLRGNEGLILA